MTGRTCTQIPWRVAHADEALIDTLGREVGLSPVTARVLVARGVDSAEAAQRFLNPSLDRDWLPPDAIPGMSAAAESVAEAVRSGRRIVVFGDFDLDGISAAAVAARGLSMLGADATPFVPHRFHEGYGLSEAAIARMLQMRPEVVVTVDCGITASAEVASLVASGIDVVITDHHEPGDSVPSGVPVADPKLDPASPCCDLAGAGVALKLVQAVGNLLAVPDVWRSLVDVATLGTIADVVPLLGENRALVAAGIAMMREDARPCVRALAEVAAVDLASMSSRSVAFNLAPRLNAAGRMADAALALELLMSDDLAEAERLALALDEHNRVRQAAEADLTESALAEAERTWNPGDRALVLAGEGWHEGVKGIVASRLASAWRLPTLLFSIDEGIARGSGRTIGNVDLYQALSRASGALDRFGGHAAAVGLSLPAESLPEFRDALMASLDALPDSDFVEDRAADGLVQLGELSHELAAELELLAPFGHGNPIPTFAACGVFMTSRQRVGRANDHLRFAAFDGVSTLPAIAFRARDVERLAEHEPAVDLLFELEDDEWRGRPRLQLVVREIHEHDVAREAPAREIVEELFASADAILAREEYAGIDEAAAFHTKLAGVTFEGRQRILERLEPGLPLRIERQPHNEHDANACALIDPHGDSVGWLNRRLAAVMAPAIDAGVGYDVTVSEITGGGEKALGVNVLVERRGDPTEDMERAVIAASRREELRACDPGALDRELTRSFIGDRSLHSAQREALDHLAAGHNTLVVMATGRGKSLIFHLHAARMALRDGKASVFVFPLRALVADQAFHLGEVLTSVGLSVCTITGESNQASRDASFAAIAEGEADVVLTTPEFLDFHAERFAATRRVGFVVVDEAHHVGRSKAGHRPSYGRLDRALQALGGPLVLATTATADTSVAKSIERVLGIDQVVLDPSVRENLQIVDGRGERDRDSALAALVSRGGKTIVYVNSRDQSVRIARMLRKRIPARGERMAFYNGGLSRSVRHAVESAFRDGDIDCVVATSAFGEGVNIPDIRNVALYHMPFNDVEFNQMCGRAGRDGDPAQIHLLFGPRDAKLNELILGSLAPTRDDMAALYRSLRDLQQECGASFEVTNAELAERCGKKHRGCTLDERGVSVALGILRELGLVDGEGSGAYRRLSLAETPAGVKVELESSVRYSEGLEEQAEFAEFKTWVLAAEPDQLLARFNRPILPGIVL